MLGGPRQVVLPGTSPGNTQAAFASLKSMRKELDIMGMGAPQSTYSTMAQEVIGAAAEAIEHCGDPHLEDVKKRLAKNPEQHSERDFTLTGAQQHDLTRVTKARLMPQGRVQELLFPTGDPHLWHH